MICNSVYSSLCCPVAKAPIAVQVTEACIQTLLFASIGLNYK